LEVSSRVRREKGSREMVGGKTGEREAEEE
jgi:hypothetical protein